MPVPSDPGLVEDPPLPPWITPFVPDAEPSDLEAAAPGRFVLLLDGAQVPNLSETAKLHGLEAACLFGGRAAEELASVAPWLVRVEPGTDPFASLLRATGTLWDVWGGSRFVLLETARSIPDLREHLRGFLRYVGEEPAGAGDLGRGQSRGTLFRFHDGAVLADWLIGTAGHPDRAAALLAVDARGDPLVHRALLRPGPPFPGLLAVECSMLRAMRPGPRPLDAIDREALRAGTDRRLVARVTARIEPKLRALDPLRSGQARAHVRGALDWLRYWGPSPREADDVFQLALLAFMLGDARDAVVAGPVMSERLVPVSQRIALTRDSLLAEMRCLDAQEERI